MINFLFSHPAALLALVVGYVLIVIEMCIPGFGIPGILGVILSVLGIITMQPTASQALIIVLVYVILLCIALAICLRSAAKGRLSKSRLVLKEVATQDKSGEKNDLNDLIGKTGLAETPLRPAGFAEIEGVRLNVITEGSFVDRGTPVRVDRISGNRIIVSPIKQ